MGIWKTIKNWFKNIERQPTIPVPGNIDDLEKYWNNKRPKTENYKYLARVLFKKRLPLDPKIFFQINDSGVPFFGEGLSNDDIALKALKYVHDNIQYTSDTSLFKEPEQWLFPFETLHLRKGDCEDGAILIANIMVKSGVPYWRIRLNAGDVQGGGHCWVTYLRESDNKWIILDWCYWYNQRGELWKSAEKYYKIWFSWNTKYVFTGSKLDR